MILTNKIEIKTTNKNIGYYNSIGFDVKSGDMITIIPEQLPKSSKLKIEVECDNCHQKLNILYHSYFRNIEDGSYHCKKCSSLKSKKTSLDKYGVDHPLQNEEIKNKVIQTNIQKYGVEYPSQNDNIKEKIKQTCLVKYGVDSYMKTHQFKIDGKNTMIKKYGVEHPLKSEEIKEKISITCYNKYGVPSPLMSDEIKMKINQSKIDKYSDKNYNNRDKYKKTCLEIFGYENPMSNIEVQNKVKKTMLNKYGVEFAAQNEELFQKMLKNGYKINKYEDLYYQGEYELDFLQNFYSIGIKRGNPIKYVFNDEVHIYFPDFYYDKLNLIIEIKSSKWYNEHLEKNLAKQKACQEQGYNFIFILDKNYEIFKKIINHIIYDKEHSWQYDIRINNKENHEKININEFTYFYVPNEDKKTCLCIKEFIEEHEWLGKMPNRPTHRFIAKYNNEIAGVVIMATPNSFSKMLGNNTKNIEKLISRGACASWTPKNLASSLIMWSINWMVKNTQFRIFSAYADSEAKELGTIYQACNFIYLGKKYGTKDLYFDLNKPKIGWFSSRNFRKLSIYKRTSKKLNIPNNWKLVSQIPIDIKIILNKDIEKYKNTCIKRVVEPKHKYVYILGENKKETNHLRKSFFELNPDLANLKYPKIR